MEFLPQAKQQHPTEACSEATSWVRVARNNEGEEEKDMRMNMMFEEWLWLMARKEGGDGVFVGGQKPLEPVQWDPPTPP